MARIPAAPLFLRLALPLAAGGCAPKAGSAARDAPAAADAAAAPREVETAVVREEVWPRTLRVDGELAAFESATLSTKISGRLESLDVDLGARVKAGEVLARIEPRDHELRVAQALAAVQAARARLGLAVENGHEEIVPENMAIVRGAQAELDDARRERDRLAGLLAQSIATQASVDAAQARLLAAESALQDALEEVENRRAQLAERGAALDLARQQLADTTIRAPFDGAVGRRLADRGEYLAAGAPLLRLVRFDPIRLRLRVPERAAPEVSAGQLVRVEVGGTGREGRLVRLSPELEPASRTLLVEAELENGDGVLRPGTFASADVVLDPSARALVVPAAALVRFAGVDRVFVVAGSRAEERRVELGRHDERGGRAEVLRGLAAGEAVVLAPGSLRHGAPVRSAP